MTTTNIGTIQITDDFIGVWVNDKRAGWIERNDTGWHAHTMTQTGTELLSTSVATPDDGAHWIAEHTA